MAQTPPPSLTAPPTAPSRADPANFAARGDAFLGWFAGAWADLTAALANVWANAVDAYTSAQASALSAAAASSSELSAAASAQASANSAGAMPWASGNYSTGAAARSNIDYRIYNARTTGAKPTDPSADPTNWKLATGNDLQNVVVTGTAQTAASGGRYWLKNAAATTLSAPPAPQPGDAFAVKVANGLTTNIIDWNGAKHEGISDATMVLDGAYMARNFIYIDAAYGWGTF